MDIRYVFVYLVMGNRNYGNSTDLLYELLANDVRLDDHYTYVTRTASKVPGPNTQVSFCDRQKYEQAVPEDEVLAEQWRSGHASGGRA